MYNSKRFKKQFRKFFNILKLCLRHSLLIVLELIVAIYERCFLSSFLIIGFVSLGLPIVQPKACHDTQQIPWLRLKILFHFPLFSNVQWLLTVFLIDLISDRELEFSEGMNK